MTKLSIAAKLSSSVTDLLELDLQGGQRAITGAMMRAGNGLKNLLRQQVVGAGLGTRLGNAWRNETYPKGRVSLNAAAYVWSNAAAIHNAFDQAVLIKRAGGLWLAIPTENTPRSRGARGATSKASPFEVEAQFNQDLILLPDKHNPGVKYLVLRVVQAKNKRGWRKGTAKRLAQARDLHDVLMFILVKQVRMPKKLDIDRAVDQIAAQIPADIVLGWNGASA